MKEYQSFMSLCKIYQDKVIKIYNDKEDIKYEINFLEKLKKENGIPKIIKTYDNVIEMNYLGEEIQYTQDKKEVRRIISEIMKLLKKIHQYQIIHNDIKPQNILINEYDEISIIDFSHSMEFDEKNVSSSLCYESPDKNKSYYSDIWSVGCVYYELLTDKILFNVDDKKEFYKMIERKEHIKLMKLMNLEQEDIDNLLQMLEIEPRKRKYVFC
jgi:serine/threonine protein kinase